MGKVSDRTALAGASFAVGDLVPVVDVSATTAGSKKATITEFLNGLVTALTAGTALTGANSATDDEFMVYDLSATAAKKMTRAELEIALRNAATAANLINLAATTLTITQATHDGRIVKLSHTGASSTVTLPDATGSGMTVKFIVGAVNTSSHIIKVPDASNTLKGVVSILDNDSNALTAYAATGTDDTLTLNGTTTGGQIGDWVELVDIAADTWHICGQLLCPAGSNVADPFSATV